MTRTLVLAFRILLLLALPLTFSSRGSASSLTGKVVAVTDGERITIISQMHPLKVKLVGIAAPDAKQPYADVAKQHLSDLLLDKYVVVRFTALSGVDVVGRCHRRTDDPRRRRMV